MIKASLIISFYNNVEYLKLIAASLERQSFRDFEIIIADDGSNQESINKVEKLSAKLPFPLKHVWQEDKRFRKNKILNKAVCASSSDYLIFIDGDCVPHSLFIKEHYDHKKEGNCFTGRRVNLSLKITALLTESSIKNGYLENRFLDEDTNFFITKYPFLFVRRAKS
jgi:glycosyltransferase involved in cell wall biosynthesis